MSILFDGFVVLNVTTPTPTPEWPIETPVVFDPITVPGVSIPTGITPEQIPESGNAVTIDPILIPEIDEAAAIDSISIPSIGAADQISSVASSEVVNPSLITAQPATLTTPPFPLNHARILYDNVLFNYSSVTQDSGATPANAIIPNTWQRWTFGSGGTITIVLPTNADIDTVCVCAHNLSGSDYTVGVDWSATDAGAWVALTPGKTPANNDALMFHNSSGTVSAKRVRVVCSGSGIDRYIGYISAGVALQMQRPNFAGVSPFNQNRKVKKYDSWTEGGNFVGTATRFVQLEGYFNYSHIDDTWFRTYFWPFWLSAESLPFVIAWNLLQYPNDVAMGFLNKGSMKSEYMGKRDLRTVEFSARGVG